jgi:hypothetical protein
MFFALLCKDINGELATWPEVIVIFDGQDGTAGGKDTDPGYKATRPVGRRPCCRSPRVQRDERFRRPGAHSPGLVASQEDM